MWLCKGFPDNPLIFLLLIIQCIGCTDPDVNPEFQNLEFELLTMDSVGVKRRIFNQNENIVFVVQATNNSDEVVELGSTWNFCHLPNNNKDYLMVYKRISYIKIQIGSPFEVPVHCLAINLPVKISPRSQQIVSGGKWFDNPNNRPLDPGIYYSSFNIVMGNQSFRSEVKFMVE